MGCGCSGSGGATDRARVAAITRVTAFEVTVDGVAVSEFASLPEARDEAGRVGGRVKVISKTVEKS